MATQTVPTRSASVGLADLLDCLEIARLIEELEATRWTGRPGYPIRAMVGMALAKSIYAIPTWTRTVALVREHGEWRFAGADYSRKTTKWRCPTGECKPASRWIKADRLHPLIPRETLRWKGLYRGRASVEREFGRLKHEWALSPLRVRGLVRVQLHADLTILAKLACALAKARAVPLAA